MSVPSRVFGTPIDELSVRPGAEGRKGLKTVFRHELAAQGISRKLIHVKRLPRADFHTDQEVLRHVEDQVAEVELVVLSLTRGDEVMVVRIVDGVTDVTMERGRPIVPDFEPAAGIADRIQRGRVDSLADAAEKCAKVFADLAFRLEP